MADKKISELVSATTVNTVDYFPVVQAGSTLKLDFATLLANIPSQPILIQTPEAPASGALSTTVRDSQVTSASGATNYTLAASTQGKQKLIVSPTMGASATAVVTVTSGVGFTTVTFNAAGQSILLENVAGSWYVLGSHGVVIA